MMMNLFQSICETLHSHLVEVTSAAENNFVANIVKLHRGRVCVAVVCAVVVQAVMVVDDSNNKQNKEDRCTDINSIQ